MEIKPTQGFFGIGERGVLYASFKRAGSVEVRSNVILLIVQGEENYVFFICQRNILKC